MTDKTVNSDVNQWFAHNQGLVDILPEKVVVEPYRILKGMGMQPADADDYLLDLISNEMEACKKKLMPEAAFNVHFSHQFSPGKYHIKLDEITFKTSKIVYSFLKKSTYLVLFSCTCGPAIENYSRELMKEGNSLEGLIVDLIGSEMAEWITEEVHLFIEKAMEQFGWGVSNRYSPGYCNWPVSEQHKLFALLGENNCGIKLTPTSLMLPIKSVSGMLGIGPGLKRLAYKCNICDDKNCIMRGK
ncbi:MAG: hypothetical protein K9H26_18590 [Prolixibacteraceae bacterium]|nr:hypothetical protein [Prolixibacteraceae bacterium]